MADTRTDLCKSVLLQVHYDYGVGWGVARVKLLKADNVISAAWMTWKRDGFCAGVIW